MKAIAIAVTVCMMLVGCKPFRMAEYRVSVTYTNGQSEVFDVIAPLDCRRGLDDHGCLFFEYKGNVACQVRRWQMLGWRNIK